MRLLPLPLLVLAMVSSACGGDDDSTSPPTTAVQVPASAPTTPMPDTTVAITASTAVDTTSPAPTTATPTGGAERFETGGWSVGTFPVIAHGPAGGWDGQYTDPGAAIVHDGVLYVFRNGFVGWPAPVGVALSTSTDGVTFTDSSAPVFDFSDLDYVGVAALASSVVVQPDGTWVMYFYIWDTYSWPRSTSSIGRATAPAPEGPWTPDPQPVLVPGGPGEWDSLSVRSPSVVVDADGTWHLWYAGSGGGKAAIGHATSRDGITWTKDAEPVLSAAEDGWDGEFVHQPRVTAGPDGYVMAYAEPSSISSPASVTQEHGLAISDDGVTWRRSADPVVTAEQAGGSAIWWTTLTWGQGRYWWLLEVGTGSQTNIHLATHEGPLVTG